MAAGDKDKAEALKAEVAELKAALPAKEEAEREQMAALQGKLAALPNLPADDVPDGEDEESNVEIARWGPPRSLDQKRLAYAKRGSVRVDLAGRRGIKKKT